MEPTQISATNMQFTRAELLYLLDSLSGKSLIGIDQRILQAELESFREKNDPAEIEKSLVAKKILVKGGKKGHNLAEEIRPVLETLFFPRQALFATRDRAGKGRQVVTAAQKDQLIVFHSFPRTGEHSVRVVPSPDNLFEFLVNWYPLFRLPASSAEFTLTEELLNRIRAMAVSGEPGEAIALLESVPLDPDEKNNFIRALRECRVSGTLAWMQVKDARIEKADSVAVLSDGRTGWLISQEDARGGGGPVFNLRRTGADLSMTIRAYVEHLADARLPRAQTDPSGKFERFSLTSMELALAFTAINCTEIASKLYLETSKDEPFEFYADRMKEAGQSLMNSGLCTLSEKGVPLLNEGLSRAVYPMAHPDWQVQVTASGGGPVADTGVYIARGRYFSAYYNHGEHLQVIEAGKHEDAGLYLESLFPGFCAEQPDPQPGATLSFDALDKIKKKEGDREEAERILLADGMPEPAARLLAQDVSDSVYRATIVRNNPPGGRRNDTARPQIATGDLVLLVKSPGRSWIISFPDGNVRGKAALADRKILRTALLGMLG
jgi:hypothetical protein